MLATSATPGTVSKLIAQMPVLQAAQIGQTVLMAVVHEAYSYTQPAPVASGPMAGCTSAGRRPLNLLQILEHAGTRPIEIGAVFEHDVHIRIAEHGLRAHGLHVRARRAGWSRSDK